MSNQELKIKKAKYKLIIAWVNLGVNIIQIAAIIVVVHMVITSGIVIQTP